MTSINRRTFVATMVGAAGNLIPASGSAASGDRSKAAGQAARQIRAGVLDVAYLELGPPDGPPVVLLHGFPYDVHCYDDVAPRLAEAGRRVIVPYLRGYGATRFLDSATPRVGQQAALGTDVVALLDAIGIQKATLAGFDWGGRAACVVAALRPDRVSGLVHSGGPGYNIQIQTEFLKPRKPGWERNHWFYWYMNSKRGMAALTNDPVGFCYYLWQNFSPTWHFDQSTFDRTAASFDNPDYVEVALHSYRFRIGEVPGDPSLEAMERQLATRPKITVPTIVIGGADEGVDPPEPAEEFAQHYTKLLRTIVLKGVGHNAPQEAPELFASAILELEN